MAKPKKKKSNKGKIAKALKRRAAYRKGGFNTGKKGSSDFSTIKGSDPSIGGNFEGTEDIDITDEQRQQAEEAAADYGFDTSEEQDNTNQNEQYTEYEVDPADIGDTSTEQNPYDTGTDEEFADRNTDSDGDGIPDYMDPNPDFYDYPDQTNKDPTRPKRTKSLIDTEARKERIETYDTSVTEGVEGELPEKTKVPDAEKITDAGTGTKTTIETGADLEAAQAGKVTLDPQALLEKVQETSGFRGGSFSAQYNPKTGNYLVSVFGRARNMTPAQFADFGKVDIADFQSISTPTETVTEGTAEEAAITRDVTATGYTAKEADEPARITEGAESEVTRTAEADGPTLTERARAADRDVQAEQQAMDVEAAERADTKDYATAILEDENFKILKEKDPTAYQRNAEIIQERERKDLLEIVSKEGTNVEEIPEFELVKNRTAQVGEAQTRIANELGTAPPIDLEGREAITGNPPVGDAAQIGGIPTMQAAEMQAVKGDERTVAAADMLKVTANMPEEVTAAISEDPATVEAQLDTDPDPTVTAAVAALPQEALVSVQMEKLLEGMEEGKTPAWARPAVAAIEQQMARRGLSTSTVGRDALFNAIIQSALPIAQSNAQALQQRAQQNLSNEQQANLAAAQNTMQVRMTNLANSQTAASQTAQMAQQIKVQQGQFRQQMRTTFAEQTQQTELANLQAAQQKASQESSQLQQAALAQLDANARMDLANLQAESTRAGKQLDADQQARLSTYQANVSRTMRQAELEQNMEIANLSPATQIELKNLTELNVASRDTMTSENQQRLVELQTLVDFKKTNASLAQQMDLANLNNEQQMELANLAERAAKDTANFTEANKFELQRLMVHTNMMSQNTELRQRAELAQLSASEKVSLSNLTAKNQADSESMSARNRAELLGYEKKMQAATVNAQLAQQMGLANLSNEQSAAMFNAQIDANLDMKQFDADQQIQLANSQFMKTMTIKNYDANQQAAMQTATALASMDLATADQQTKLSIENARNFLQMDMANLSNDQQALMLDSQLAQQRLLSNQAAENVARQFGAKSQNEVNTFMANVAKEIELTNKAALNSMEQFNANSNNAAEARDAARLSDFEKFNASMRQDIAKFSEQIQFNRDSWNAQNAAAVEAADIADKRRRNEIDTATQNAVNMQNAANAFKLSTQSLAFLNQEMRDQADHEFKSYESAEARAASIVVAALGAADNTFDDSKWTSSLRSNINILLGLVG